MWKELKYINFTIGKVLEYVLNKVKIQRLCTWGNNKTNDQEYRKLRLDNKTYVKKVHVDINIRIYTCISTQKDCEDSLRAQIGYAIQIHQVSSSVVI